ncbi:MAG: glycosyltransferase family 2 protein [Acetobacter sp.]|nr:glycosyltransferase family 2 protein [Acetobacter sp.]
MKKLAELAIIVPCYNEEEILPDSINTLNKIYKNLITEKLISPASKLVFVNDGSKDKTWQIIEVANKKHEHIKGICLSRNFGHQEALLAGLYSTKADIYITIDADLQDDPTVIKNMIKKYYNGAEIVYGVRNRRDTDSFFKRNTALWFYKIMKILGVELVSNHADFRLLSQRAVQTMAEFKEKNLFLRAIVPLIGFKSANVYYDRKKREAGTTKYPLKKMILFALKGISSFSAVPLHIITLSGVLISTLSFFLMLWTVIAYFNGSTIIGWTSLMSAITFFSGITILFMGIIGEYIASIFIEVKNRPTYIIDKTLD